MKLIVITEVERFMFRPNLPERARYYAVTFLNQIMLTQKDVQVADKLIHLYFSVFQAIVKTLKKDKEESDNKLKRKKKPRTFRKQVLVTSKSSHASSSLVSVDSVNSKMMASLLTGVNRAFPFAKMDSKLYRLLT